MAYEKLNLKNGTVLNETHLAHFENGIVANELITAEHIGVKILRGEIKKIKLIGDSITDGYGGTGYNGNQQHTISTNTDGYCWANAFKKFASERYGVQVINKGIYGSHLEEQISHFNSFIEEDDDLYIWLSGANNRTTQERIEYYKNNLSEAIAVLEENAPVLLMSSLPASEENELTTMGTMQDINDICKVCAYGLTFFVPLYEKAIKYNENHNLNLSDILIDGLHPNDTGHLIIFKILCNALGLGLNSYTDYSQAGGWWNATATCECEHEADLVIIDNGNNTFTVSPETPKNKTKYVFFKNGDKDVKDMTFIPISTDSHWLLIGTDFASKAWSMVMPEGATKMQPYSTFTIPSSGAGASRIGQTVVGTLTPSGGNQYIVTNGAARFTLSDTGLLTVVSADDNEVWTMDVSGVFDSADVPNLRLGIMAYVPGAQFQVIPH
jgi:lysophospholipase L1-like esterase